MNKSKCSRCDFPLISSVTLVQGFCDTEANADDNRGTFEWDETGVNTTATTACPFGPKEVTITRSCDMRLNWSVPVIDLCATFITPEFIALNETINQVCKGPCYKN